MEKDKDVADRDQRHREFMEKLFPAESLHQRLHPRRSIPRVRERFGDQLHRRRDLLRPLVKIHVRGQPFVVNKSHDGYATIERWITVAGLLTHPWASLDGLARSNEHTFMMLKDWNSSVGDSDGVRDRPIITIKQIQVAPPLQRQGLATEILKTMLASFTLNTSSAARLPARMRKRGIRTLTALCPAGCSTSRSIPTETTCHEEFAGVSPREKIWTRTNSSDPPP